MATASPKRERFPGCLAHAVIGAFSAWLPTDANPTSTYTHIIGCWRFTKFWRVGKLINVIVKPTNSPTQGQPNPRKNILSRLKAAVGPLFPTANTFSWVGIYFIEETKYKKPNPNQFFRKHPDIYRRVTTSLPTDANPAYI